MRRALCFILFTALVSFSLPIVASASVTENAERQVNAAIADLRAAMERGVASMSDRSAIKNGFKRIVDLHVQIAGNSQIPDDVESALTQKMDAEVSRESRKLMQEYAQIDSNLSFWPAAWQAIANSFLSLLPADKNSSGLIRPSIPAGLPVIGEYSQLDRMIKGILNHSRIGYRIGLKRVRRNSDSLRQYSLAMQKYVDGFWDRDEIALEKTHEGFHLFFLSVAVWVAMNAPELGERTDWGPVIFGTLYTIFITRPIVNLHLRSSGLSNFAAYEDLRSVVKLETNLVGLGVTTLPRRVRNFAMDHAKMICRSGLIKVGIMKDRFDPANLE